ncbi:peptidyl-prolyl cis-trans isomerase A (cyclophilin A) [Comamonas sp. BIGb0124]|uniref:peptidylprolyl isomerase n=1 Tax=Comamonas sp. BIGb0124 TaxID=2485130 RepID=UPI000F4693A0|nr:peptidylprolyl isomerase [Comamonas sp. BIGb0124]ROR20213.1 peptidyl-prolyl cis-trans isomerase A (cyclophilin A) [Comamonas sp. BIGb0124]
MNTNRSSFFTSSATRRQWGIRLSGLALALAVTMPAMAQTAAAGSSQPVVRFKTTAGDIVLTLDAAKAPVTVANFVQYVKDGHYNGTIFHRVIDGFMIQGGGFNADMRERETRAPIKLEAGNGLRNTRGTVAMARTRDPNSATAQFFINVADNANLDAPRPDGHGYAVFGRVTQGMEVIDKIRAVQTGNRGPHQNVPVTPITITQATLER